MQNGKILITGGAGKLGTAVVESLLKRPEVDPQNLIVTTRNPARLATLAERGVAVRSADFEKIETLKTAFEGAKSMLLVSIDQVGQREKLHSNAIAAAEGAGVQHLIYTSMPAPEESPVVFAPEHLGSEECLRVSQIPSWTILRNNWYFENLIEFQASIIQSGTWITASASGRTAQLSRDDLARAAADVLLSACSNKRVLTLNGLESLSVDQMASRMSSILGFPIQVVHTDDAGFRATLAEAGLPQPVIDMMASFEAHNAAGHSSGSVNDFQTLTGTAPKSFKDWLKENKSDLLALRER